MAVEGVGAVVLGVPPADVEYQFKLLPVLPVAVSGNALTF